MTMLYVPISPPTGGLAMNRITVIQGQARVSPDPRFEFTTVLGSCVAACLYDADVRVGGMNHFLLAEPAISQAGTTIDEHYGVYLMEVLINGMLAQGARKQRLRAHLYGGANLHPGMMRIGSANAAFAREFLQREQIALIREDLGGDCARRVDFRPATGQVRCRRVERAQAPEPQPTSRPARGTGDVELF
ncbi:MAG: chemotaxis protein CheD [Novosphingobium sp.]